MIPGDTEETVDEQERDKEKKGWRWRSDKHTDLLRLYFNKAHTFISYSLGLPQQN